jgi:hypothetical protein
MLNIQFRIDYYCALLSKFYTLQIMNMIQNTAYILLCNKQNRKMIYLIIYILLSTAISFISIGKRISFWGVFFISIFLTPVVGLISVLKAHNNIIKYHYTVTDTCYSCNQKINATDTNCSVCGNEVGSVPTKKVKLTLV